jgi:hypothetical protein
MENDPRVAEWIFINYNPNASDEDWFEGIRSSRIFP